MSNPGQRFRDLRVWNESVELARGVYRLTEQFPSRETYGLCSQLRRAAVSVASNIAEGSARSSRKDFRHFVEVALGSLAEMETQLEISLVFARPSAQHEDVVGRMQSVRMMLYRLHGSLSR